MPKLKLRQLYFGLLLLPGMVGAEAVPVELRETEDGWQLLRKSP